MLVLLSFLLAIIGHVAAQSAPHTHIRVSPRAAPRAAVDWSSTVDRRRAQHINRNATIPGSDGGSFILDSCFRGCNFFDLGAGWLALFFYVVCRLLLDPIVFATLRCRVDPDKELRPPPLWPVDRCTQLPLTTFF